MTRNQRGPLWIEARSPLATTAQAVPSGGPPHSQVCPGASTPSAAFIIVKLLGRRRMPYESSAGNCIELCLRSCRPRLGGDAEADLGAPEAKPFANGLYLPTFLSPPRYAGVLTRFSEILPGGETIDGSWISAAEDGRDLKLVRSSVARGTGGGGAVGELRSLILPTGEASSGGIRLMQGGPLGSRERMYGALIFSLRCR
eukprot:CAMPEP_0167784770 /NCGR_PEP_ID=MMETSP0111_2-20121227/7837_1 /TAXON_ID=91324 /ORGANISM="Lotharella globosa, Strain CCCM811" /LENGTH=199 /DNA_ID=CAMNT_0007675909 /DNA_START=94 /DNA_END=689 /DNA_ORIENTATION=+